MASSDLNWDHIIEMATRHRLRPLLYYNLNLICPDKVPEDVLIDLREFYHENVRKNLMLTGELVKVMALLEDNGIKSFTYKGPVLASQAYGNIGLREFGDIDIFIDKKDALKVKDLMIKNGYNSNIGADDLIYLNLESEYRFINNTSKALIEINWNFQGNFFSFTYNLDFLLRNMKKYNLNKFNLNTPSNNNQLLMLFVHTAKHDWSQLLWICDISKYINQKSIDWNEILEKAEKLRIKRILRINLKLAIDLFDLQVPITVLNYINSDEDCIIISNKIKKRIFLKQNLTLFQKFNLDLKKRENFHDSVNDCINGLTKTSYKDFQDLKLPRYLFRIYRLIRPFLLLKRYLI